MPDLLAHLNPQQLAAVTLPAEHALILAGAGSGKTRVLTTRLAWLVSTGQASPAAMLAVTFTNKAAREMVARISAMLPINPRGMWIGTFHGLCNRLLRTHHRDAGLPPSFQILDSQDQLAAIKRVLRGLNADDQKFPPRNVQYFINGEKEEGRRPDAVEIVDDHTGEVFVAARLYFDQIEQSYHVDSQRHRDSSFANQTQQLSVLQSELVRFSVRGLQFQTVDGKTLTPEEARTRLEDKPAVLLIPKDASIHPAIKATLNPNALVISKVRGARPMTLVTRPTTR